MADVTEMILSEIRAVQGVVELHRGETVTCRTQVSRELGELGVRVDGVRERLDKMNGSVDAAIAAAGDAKRTARNWGASTAAVITALGLIGAAIARAAMG